MRLRRIDAVRFGSLPSDSSLGDLGEGLTVVVGPNEAGKTSYTSLVRHVLFGFPNARSSERLYLPANGDKRSGRLVFAEGAEEWVLERVDGTRGGAVSVIGREGESFATSLTAGVTPGVYRSVFGFGLDELADIGTLGDIQQRLYATAAGLRVNPQDVREQLRERAEAIWSAQGRTKAVHKLNGELRDVRDRIREVERRAEAFRSERAELDGLTAQAMEADETARDKRLQASRLAARLAAARQLDAQVRAADGERDDLLRRLAEARDAEAAQHVDEAVLERAASIDDLAARAGSFQETVTAAASSAERVRTAEATHTEAVAVLGMGWDEARIAQVPRGLTVDAGIDEAEERLRDARRQFENASADAADAHAEASRLREEAAALASSLGLEAVELERETQARLAAVAELLKPAPAAASTRVPALAAAAVAVLMAVGGIVLRDWPLAVAAVAPLGLAAWLFLTARLAASRTADPEVLRAARLPETPTDRHLYATQASLQSLLAAARALREVEARIAVLEARVAAASADLASVSAEWETWLAGNGLTGAGEPRAARAVLREVRQAQEARRKLAEAADAEAAARTACLAYGESALAAGLVSPEDASDPVAVASAVRAAAARLAESREAERRRADARAEARRLSEEIDRLEQRVAKTADELRSQLTDADAHEGRLLTDLEALADLAAQDAERAEDSARELLQRKSILEGRLDGAAQDAEGARLKLEEAGLKERLRQQVERFAVLATAQRLMEETLAVYERDRQPAIVQRAAEIFDRMTDGRYPRVITPLGSFALSVQDGESRTKESAKLSTGTAQLLYLALRLAYIENLHDVHPALPVLMDDVLVNFDDEGRQAAAAVAIAEFSQKRQVVFFTCHERVASLFADTAPGHARLALERC